MEALVKDELKTTVKSTTNKSRVGKITENITVVTILQKYKDLSVFLPEDPSSVIDVVVTRDYKKYVRLQIKTAYKSRNTYKAHICCFRKLTKTNTNPRKLYSKEHIDFVVVYTPEDQCFYILPPEIFENRYEFILGKRNKVETDYYKNAWHLLEKELT